VTAVRVRLSRRNDVKRPPHPLSLHPDPFQDSPHARARLPASSSQVTAPRPRQQPPAHGGTAAHLTPAPRPIRPRPASLPPARVPGLTPGATLFATFGAAVAAASPGDTINVADGAYSELVTVNKAGLVIRGNQFGVDARTGRPGAAETVVSGNAGTTSFYVTA